MKVTGIFFYYARVVYGKMLTALSAIASEKSAPNERIINKCKQLIDYAVTQPDAIITYWTGSSPERPLFYMRYHLREPQSFK